MANRLSDANILKASCGCWVYLNGIKLKGKMQIVSSACVKISGKMMYAHRVAWEDRNGEIPEGLLVLHTCDVGACVNPDHLYLGDYKDNAKDRTDRKRFAAPSEKFKNSQKGKKFSEEHKNKIRATLFGNKRGAGSKGRLHTEASRKNMSIGQAARREKERAKAKELPSWN